jgi:hypothetical protein
MRRTRTGLGMRLGFEELEPRALLSVSPFFSSSASYSAGAGGIVAPGTGTSFGAGTSGTPIGAEYGDVDSGGFGPSEGFGSGFGVPGGSGEAGPSGFGAVGSGGFGTAAGLPDGIGIPGTMPAAVGLGSLATAGGLATPSASFGTLPDGAFSAAARDDSGVGQMTITTGANTLGIRSFASPTSGYSSGFTGAGGPLSSGDSEEDSAPNLEKRPARDDTSLILGIELLFADDHDQPRIETDGTGAVSVAADVETIAVISR